MELARVSTDHRRHASSSCPAIVPPIHPISGLRLMDFSERPLEAGPLRDIVVRAVRDIDDSGSERRDVLLWDLLCVAWASVEGQNQ
jgi:hypothetical protein